MRQLIRSAILKLSPEVFYAITSFRFFLRCKERYDEFQNKFVTKVFPKGEIHILEGPFKGMPYYNKVIWGPITSKWIGSYEEELHSIIDQIIQKNYGTIIDVGAAEGYYAVGFGFTCKNSKIISYDIDPIARYRQRQLVATTGISNLDIRKYCSHADLERDAVPGSFVMSDVEGFEYELLDPKECPALRSCDILVEIHNSGDLKVPQVEAAIVDRFQSTHHIQTYSVTPRDASAYKQALPQLSACTLEEIDFALDEGRMPSQRWLWMQSKNS